MFGSREARRAQVYTRLAALADAGIPLKSATAQIADPALESVSHALAEGLEAGAAWESGGRFSRLETSIVQAGARSGQLVESFRSLALVFEEKAKVKRDLALGLAYPVFLAHAVVFIPTLPIIVKDGLGAYVAATFVPLLIAYAVLAVLFLSIAPLRRAFPRAVDGLVAALPVIGGLARKRATVQGLHAFLALYKAGVPVTEAVSAASDAATLEPVKQAFRNIGERLSSGATIGDAFFKEQTLPIVVREAAATGGISGHLEETLSGARAAVEAEAKTAKGFLLIAIPIVAFLFVAAAIGWTVISGMQGYVKMLDDIK